jgi:hypothetical protein
MFKAQNLYQNDPRWKSKQLGNSSEKAGTIGAWGCLLTSITMVLNTMGYNETPDTANDKIKAVGGFQDAGLIASMVPYAFSSIMYKGFTACENSPAPLDLIDSALAAGKPVILQVDWSKEGGTQTHYVVAKDRQGLDYLLYDPYMYGGDSPTKDVLLTKRYKYNGGTLETEISGVFWFDGTIAPTPPTPMKLPLPAEKFILYVIEDDLSLRGDPSTSGYLWKRMVAGTELISLEDKAATKAKLGQQGQWIKVQDPKGDQGYVAAWYVSDTKGAPATAASTTTSVTSTTSSTVTPMVVPPGALLLTPTEEMSFRSQPLVADSTLIRRVPVTEQFISLEPASQAIAKVGKENQWINVKDGAGKTGYLAAWYVKYSGGATAQAQAQAQPVATSSGPVKVKASVEGVAFRNQPVISDASLIKRVPIGTEFTLSSVSDASKIGLTDQWLKVKDPANAEGYVAAWFVIK